VENSFLSWISSITDKLGINLMHLDGKTAKGSYDREKKLKSLHTVSAWSSEQGLVLAQQKVDSKSNEIKAVPILLKLLNLKGTVVTLDTMGTQTEIAAQIKQGEGDYVLALKGNQGKLHQQVEDWLKLAQDTNWQGIDYSYHETVEAGHHRLETRQVWAVPVSQLPALHRQSLWVGLTTVVMVSSTSELWYAAENLGLLRRLSVNLLKREQSRLSLKMKRFKAGMSNDFLLQILEASAA
jgi:predicted transposase YbfD/YdcC